MMSDIQKKSTYLGLPPTTRATALVLGGDPKGKNFLYCTNNCVVIRSLENPNEHDLYFESQKRPTVAKYSPSGYYICSGDVAGQIRIWDTTQAEHLLKCEYSSLGGEIRDISWDSESKRIAVCGDGREKFAHVFLWDSGASVGKLDKIEKISNSVDIKPNRPYRCAVASDDFHTYFYAGPPFKISTIITEEGKRFANCVRFSPDGKYLASSNSDGNIYLFDGKDCGYIGVFTGHKGGVYSICFNSDGTELLSASADKTCKLWNVESKEILVDFVMGTTVEDQQLSCLWQGEHLLSVSLSGEIKYLDRNNPSTPLRVLTGHNKSITTVTTKLDEAIYTASFDGVIVRWETATGNARRFTGKGHGTKVTSLAYDPTSNQVVSAGLDNKVRFTDCDTLQFSTDVVGLDSEPFVIEFPRAGEIMVGCHKELVLIKDGKKVSSFPLEQASRPLATARGSRVIAAGKVEMGQRYFHVLDIDGDKIIDSGTTFKALDNSDALKLSPDGGRLAIAIANKVLMYTLVDGFEKSPVEVVRHSVNVKCFSWSPDGTHVASASSDGRLSITDVDKGTKLITNKSHPKSNVVDVAWLNDRTVVSVGEDCTVSQWTF